LKIVIRYSRRRKREQDPMTMFVYALKAPETQSHWPGSLKIFLDFLKLGGNGRKS